MKYLKTNQIVIFDNLDFDNWLIVLNSSKQVITPECGCSHVSAACNTIVNIIYDSDNLPDAINKEYAPWRKEYYKFEFKDKELNNKIIQRLN